VAQEKSLTLVHVTVVISVARTFSFDFLSLFYNLRGRQTRGGPGGRGLTPAEVAQTAGSGRAALLQGIAAALDRGDTVEAQRLREDFALRTRLRADPTQAEGSYSPFLDGDLWYAQARARAMAPKKKSPQE
jgi:hypothetical protein